VVGALLTLPGASYLAALQHVHKQHLSATSTVLVVILVNVIMLVLIEVPLLGFVVAPTWTPTAVERTKAWVSAHLHVVAVRGMTIIGLLLVLKGVLGLV
jgi:hypothetical protein